MDLALRYLRPRTPKEARFTLAEVVAAAAEHLRAFIGRDRRPTIERYSLLDHRYMAEFD